MYRIDVVKTIGDAVTNEPVITIEKRAAALEKVRELAEAYEAELNAEMMRFVVGDISIHCEKCASPLGDATDIIAYARIKRPLHSPKATVFYGE